jgi:signal transduction histidine kinase/CheY-like chemotaxis protein
VRRASLLGDIVAGAEVAHIAEIETERLLRGALREQVLVGIPEATLVVEAHAAGDGGEAIVVIHDITVERAQQQKAAHQERLALIGQLAGGIAHDFNNLLCVILNYAEIMADSASTPEQLEDARTVTDAAKSATELVRQLLSFARREAVRPVVIDVAGQIAAREKLFKRTVGAGVRVVVERCPEPIHVLIDLSQLEQIVMNLAVNARDAMADNGELRIAVSATPTTAIIEVADTGCGMTAEVIARMFEPYFTTKARGKGTGLGLAMVHGIVQHASGTIAVRSQPGEGTTFTIMLPRTNLAPAETATRAAQPTACGRVLVVDDDPQVRRVTERMLRHAGYDVVAVDSAAAGLATARDAKFDVVLTDVVMPGMSGRDLARELGSAFPDLPVVLMSGYPTTAIAGQPFLAKPFDRGKLLAVVQDVSPTGRRASWT